MLLHSLYQYCWLLTDALWMQLQVGIELELRLAKSSVPVYAFVSHLLVCPSRRHAELVVFTGLFGSVVTYWH